MNEKNMKVMRSNKLIGRNINDFLHLIRNTRITFKSFGIDSSLYKRMKQFSSIREARDKYSWRLNEYLLYHYPLLSDGERQNFINELQHVLFSEAVNSKEAVELLSSKWQTFVTYKSFFKREVCFIDESNVSLNRECYKQLLNNKKQLFIKPNRGSFGMGACIVDETSGDLDALLKNNPKGFVAEELIVQDSRMAQLHPESVNTLRIHTLQNNGKVKVFHPYIRIGRGGNVVDNAGAGGVFTSCNPDTGEVLTVVDEFGHSYTKHPDNGFPLIGFKVPCWTEAYEMAKALALSNQDIHYAGWDLALTIDGWVLVEGNPRAQMVFQISEQRGFKQECQDILKELGIEYSLS